METDSKSPVLDNGQPAAILAASGVSADQTAKKKTDNKIKNFIALKKDMGT
ncbi:MAG: hypothetical protein HY880_09200 [Deltaproteobacteria bacterium]|nr:hypothetical protein [Deltaproteobacteria bacterium]